MAKAKKEKKTEISVSEVVDYIKFAGAFGAALESSLKRKITAQAAKEQGMKITDKELQAAIDAHRIANGLSQGADFQAWLSSRGLTAESLEDYTETTLLVHAFKNSLEAKADKTKYLDDPEVKGCIRERVYADWLARNLK